MQAGKQQRCADLRNLNVRIVAPEGGNYTCRGYGRNQPALTDSPLGPLRFQELVLKPAQTSAHLCAFMRFEALATRRRRVRSAPNLC